MSSDFQCIYSLVLSLPNGQCSYVRFTYNIEIYSLESGEQTTPTATANSRQYSLKFHLFLSWCTHHQVWSSTLSRHKCLLNDFPIYTRARTGLQIFNMEVLVYTHLRYQSPISREIVTSTELRMIVGSDVRQNSQRISQMSRSVVTTINGVSPSDIKYSPRRIHHKLSVVNP